MCVFFLRFKKRKIAPKRENLVEITIKNRFVQNFLKNKIARLGKFAKKLKKEETLLAKSYIIFETGLVKEPTLNIGFFAGSFLKAQWFLEFFENTLESEVITKSKELP